MNSNSKGFTLLEILVALGIMAVGFLAMSQMQYLSFKQKTLAESGTFATNMIGTVSDFELANARILSLLNARVYLDSQASKTIINQDDYCDGSDDAICEECPCNPLEEFVSDSFNLLAPGGDTEITCAPIDSNNFNPGDMEFFLEANDCENVDGLTPNFYVFRRVNSNFDTTVTPNLINLNITYILKTAQQFDSDANRTAMGSGEITNIIFGNSVGQQNIQVSAHVERDWTNFIMLGTGNWNEVIVPHIP